MVILLIAGTAPSAAGMAWISPLANLFSFDF
jgi:hypothetical protein